MERCINNRGRQRGFCLSASLSLMLTFVAVSADAASSASALESFELQRKHSAEIEQATTRAGDSNRESRSATPRPPTKQISPNEPAPYPCPGFVVDGGPLSSVLFRGDEKMKIIDEDGVSEFNKKICPNFRWSRWIRAVTHEAVNVGNDSTGRVTFPRNEPPGESVQQSSGTVVKIREAAATPSIVRPGDLLVISTDYSLVSLDHLDDLEVAEEWHLKSDSQAKRRGFGIGPELSVYAIKQRRKPGGWRATVTVAVPEDAVREGYSIRHYINTGTHHDQRDVRILVE
jgi:hypothetical protein